MKRLSVVIIALVAFVAADKEWKPITDGVTYRQVHESCVKETGLTSEQVEKIRNMELADEKDVHEYVLCHVKKIGIFTEEVGYNADRILSQFVALNIATDEARNAVAKCVNGNGENNIPAVWAYLGADCLMRNNVDKLLKKALHCIY